MAYIAKIETFFRNFDSIYVFGTFTLTVKRPVQNHNDVQWLEEEKEGKNQKRVCIQEYVEKLNEKVPGTCF